MGKQKSEAVKVDVSKFVPAGAGAIQLALEKQMEQVAAIPDVQKAFADAVQQGCERYAELEAAIEEATVAFNDAVASAEQTHVDSVGQVYAEMAEIEQRFGVKAKKRGRKPGRKSKGAGRPRSAISPTGTILILDCLSEKRGKDIAAITDRALHKGWETEANEDHQKAIISQELQKLVANGHASRPARGSYVRTEEGVRVATEKRKELATKEAVKEAEKQTEQ